MWTRSISSWTVVGLVIALFGLPTIVFCFRALVESTTAESMVWREGLIFALAGALLWIVLRRERLGLDSIGLRFESPGRAFLRGVLLTVGLFGIVILTLAGFSLFGVQYGAGSAIAPSTSVVLLTVLRAGICEEIFYRGFAIERLEQLTGSKWIAAGVSLVAFAGFHYRQGIPGVFLALVLGAALSAFYLWKRDLLAAIIAHFLVDLIPNILLPLLSAEAS